MAAALAVLEALSLALLALLALTGWHAWRRTQASVLLRFAGGFGALALADAVALALEVSTHSVAAIPAQGVDLFDALFWLHHAGVVAGFGLILSTFDRRKWRLVLAVGPVLLVASPILHLLAVVLAFLVVAHAGLNHIERARRGSFQTATGFFLLLAAQLLFLLDAHPLAPRNAAGQAVQVAGLVVLVLAARMRGRRA